MVRDGATLSTKDDLSVVLGEFDLTSDSDEFDTNRFTGSLCFYHLSKNPISLRKNVRLAIDPIVHEDYQSGVQYNNDIALLKLAEEVDTEIHTPACLASADADYTGQNGRVYGEQSIIKPDIPLLTRMGLHRLLPRHQPDDLARGGAHHHLRLGVRGPDERLGHVHGPGHWGVRHGFVQL